MKQYFAYTRVSTTKQGQNGTSLIEQREAIRRFAERNNLKIVHEYEEQETAAKRGRSVFGEMIKAVKRGDAAGIIMHKIDRSARNLRDWAELGDLIDSGVDINFVNENLDLHSRGGRLSADIQAVVAADYIRNLREEVIKGIYGRLKQGFYPMPAPIGYLNCGKGKLKEIDPQRGPLIRRAFEIYSTGNIGLNELTEQMEELGLQTKHGRRIGKSEWAVILRNPFYAGIMRIKKSGETFTGKHEALVSQKLFDRVQALMDGRLAGNKRIHDHLFRRLLKCAGCSNFLVGERQKGRVYYRCHTLGCSQKTIREDAAEDTLLSLFKELRFTEAENDEIRNSLAERYRHAASTRERELRLYNLQLENVRNRLSTLVDAYLDRTFDRETYLDKKNYYVVEERTIVGKLEKAKSGEDEVLKEVENILELVNDAYLSYKTADREDRRVLIETISSNLQVEDKSLIVKLNYPFQLIADRLKTEDGAPPQDTARTISTLLNQLHEHFSKIVPTKKLTPHPQS